MISKNFLLWVMLLLVVSAAIASLFATKIGIFAMMVFPFVAAVILLVVILINWRR